MQSTHSDATYNNVGHSNNFLRDQLSSRLSRFEQILIIIDRSDKMVSLQVRCAVKITKIELASVVTNAYNITNKCRATKIEFDLTFFFNEGFFFFFYSII